MRLWLRSQGGPKTTFKEYKFRFYVTGGQVQGMQGVTGTLDLLHNDVMRCSWAGQPKPSAEVLRRSQWYQMLRALKVKGQRSPGVTYPIINMAISQTGTHPS